MRTKPVRADAVPAPPQSTIYPEPFAAVVAGRDKRKLGNFFGLSNFGVNLTRLAPGAASALFHRHARQDEFVYILEGTPTLLLGDDEFAMQPGECVGFKAASGLAHQLVNRSSTVVAYLEVGDRAPDDAVEYPKDDLKAVLDEKGAWLLTHKDGRPY